MCVSLHMIFLPCIQIIVSLMIHLTQIVLVEQFALLSLY